MLNIEENIELWSRIRFGEVPMDDSIDLKNINLIKKSLFELGLEDKFMDGFSTEKLLVQSNAEGSGGEKMTEIFHECVKNNNLSPAMYLASFANRYINKNKDLSKLNGFLARAMRSFGAFLREPDLAYKLKKELENFFENIEVNMDPDQDLKRHIDIEINCDGNILNVWSYQASDKGLPNTIDRLVGNRGPVASGINVLCPINTFSAQNFIDKQKSLKKKKEQIINWEKELTQKISNSRRRKVEENLIKNRDLYHDKKNALKSIEDEILKEVSLNKGWFLYSDFYVKEMAIIIHETLNGRKSAMEYSDLQNILEKPKDLVTRKLIFNN